MSKKNLRPQFWKNFMLHQLTKPEWEALCDRCGLCCLHKLEDEEEEGKIWFTKVGCCYLVPEEARCMAYQDRSYLVENCIQLTPSLAAQLYRFPPTCAYRLVAEGKDLLPWHPLLSGKAASVREAGISVVGWVIPEGAVDLENLEDYIFEPPQP